MASILVVGGIGTGKTLLMTFMALDDERDVYANYQINIPRFHKLSPAKLERVQKSALILIDEGYIWMESRTSSSMSNRFWTYVVFQSRKRTIDMVTTCQMYSSLDIRFRTMADWVIEAEKDERGFRYTVYQGGRDLETSRYVEPIGTFGIDFELAKEIYPIYDTMELVSPIDSFMTAGIESDPEEINELVDTIVAELQQEIRGVQLRRFHVEDFCLKHGYPAKYAKFVWNRLSAGEKGA